MKRDNINYLAVGVFVLLAMGVLLIVLYRLTGRVGGSDPYHVYYSNISGLIHGARVTYQGYQVGVVADVEPEQSEKGTRYRVNLQVKQDWKIPSDSVARIYSSGLLAETVIDIEEGKSRVYLSEGGEISGQPGTDMFATLSDVAGDIGGLTRDSVRPLLDNLNAHVSGLGNELAVRIPNILDGLESMVEQLDQGAERLAGLLDERAANSMRAIIDDVAATAKNFHRFSSGLQSTQSELDGLLQDAHRVIEANDGDIRATALALRKSLDSISGEVDGILFELESASRNINEFSRELRSNPGLLFNGRPAEQPRVSRD
jgi:phospholipid/cholesterol/gamma-HCH transport system substrate-binding protein